MHFPVAFGLLLGFAASLSAQPNRNRPPDSIKKSHNNVKLEVKGKIEVNSKRPIDNNPLILTEYERDSGVMISSAAFSPHYRLTRFWLYVGENADFRDVVSKLDGQWATVEGELIIVHSPAQFTHFGGGYHHTLPKYVIRVERLITVAAPKPDVEHEPSIIVSVRGVLKTNGRNVIRIDDKPGTLDDLIEGKASIGTSIESSPCSFQLFLGDKDRWLEQAKKLKDKPATVRGELRFIKHRFSSRETADFVSANGLPLGYYFIEVQKLDP